MRPTVPGSVLAALLLAPSAVAQVSDATRLHALFDSAWAFELREDPLLATEVGDHRSNDRLPAVNKDAETRRAQARRGFLDRLRAIDRAALDRTDRVSYDVFERQLRDRIGEFDYSGYLLPLTADYGFHMGFADLPNRVPLANTKDYENYVARLRAFPAYVAEHIALMREGLALGVTVPRVTLQGYESTIASHVVEDVTKSVFWAPVERFPPGVPAAERERVRAAIRAAIAESVVPAYRTFLEFMTRDYIPGARATLGATALPNGAAYYRFLVRRYTTLEVTPEQVHRTGLAEVQRIRTEMDAVIRRTGFQGAFAAFLAFLRSDARFYAKTPDELLKEAAWIAKRMDGKLPSLFKTLPRLPYGVEPVPGHIAPKFTAGRYISAPIGGRRAGYYWVNTYALESRPLYALEALTLHEAVPGHHLQIALAQELEGLPAFRRFGAVTAFTEGWGLYAERLGLEAGFYTDPYRDFGRLTYEMWRACRLVIDTGIHAMGWTREQALDYLARNTALSLHEVRTEIDRYISWPGQALAYKTGELKIRELRALAERELGERFDIREFHDALLRNGEVPLAVLEEQVRDWVRESGAAR